MTKALAFNGVKFNTTSQNNQLWIRGYQVGTALEYSEPSLAIRKLYTAHADEFTDSMTQVVKLPTDGGMQDVRIFSLRGCHLLGMFAKTKKAKEFRRWVLDILDELSATEHEKKVKRKVTSRKQYGFGMYGYLDMVEDMVRESYENLTGKEQLLFFALEQHGHRMTLNTHEALLLRSIHDYTRQAIAGAKLFLDGVDGCKRIKNAISF